MERGVRKIHRWTGETRRDQGEETFVWAKTMVDTVGSKDANHRIRSDTGDTIGLRDSRRYDEED